MRGFVLRNDVLNCSRTILVCQGEPNVVPELGIKLCLVSLIGSPAKSGLWENTLRRASSRACDEIVDALWNFVTPSREATQGPSAVHSASLHD